MNRKECPLCTEWKIFCNVAKSLHQELGDQVGYKQESLKDRLRANGWPHKFDPLIIRN